MPDRGSGAWETWKSQEGKGPSLHSLLPPAPDSQREVLNLLPPKIYQAGDILFHPHPQFQVPHPRPGREEESQILS